MWYHLHAITSLKGACITIIIHRFNLQGNVAWKRYKKLYHFFSDSYGPVKNCAKWIYVKDKFLFLSNLTNRFTFYVHRKCIVYSSIVMYHLFTCFSNPAEAPSYSILLPLFRSFFYLYDHHITSIPVSCMNALVTPPKTSNSYHHHQQCCRFAGLQRKKGGNTGRRRRKSTCLCFTGNGIVKRWNEFVRFEWNTK